MTGETLIELRSLTKTYGTGEAAFQALPQCPGRLQPVNEFAASEAMLRHHVGSTGAAASVGAGRGRAPSAASRAPADAATTGSRHARNRINGESGSGCLSGAARA
jgi:hypothetical protein